MCSAVFLLHYQFIMSYIYLSHIFYEYNLIIFINAFLNYYFYYIGNF